MEKHYIIISMYTVNTPYEQEIKKLEASLKQFNLPYKFYPIKSTGDWTKNTMRKSKIILDALNEFNKDIVWLDADAVVLKEPKLFDDLKQYDFDVCCHRWKPKYEKCETGEVLSGTLYFKNSQHSKNLVGEWVDVCNTKKDWDQRLLRDVLDTDVFKVRQLPVEYITIEKFEKHQGKVDCPVVMQHQASRKFRKKV